jgi:2-polyprenyl-6-methoxyphenol hydroxylase-like FAD-dependent oxidoreductase
MKHALVLGGGMAGMLAAKALTDTAERVTVVDSDTFPDGPLPRRGLPQGHHNHMFMRGGVEALDDLLPGTSAALTAAGAKRRALPSGNLTQSGEGWFRRHHSDAYALLCSRALTDHIVRGAVLADPRIVLREGVKVDALTGDARRVTGARVTTADGAVEDLTADLVVDATGRRSRAPEWLAALGAPAVREEVVDGGFAYASRFYEAPEDVRPDFPGVLIQAQAGTGEAGRGAALLPNEGRRWIVTLFGTRGATPPTDEDGFEEFARTSRSPLIHRLVTQARPLSEIRPFRGMANRRRYYEELAGPDGFLVIGDSATAVNPNYGTGMSVAALSARVLRDHLRREGGLRPGGLRKIQKGIARAGNPAWQSAIATDHFFPDVTSTVRRQPKRSQLAMSARIARVAAENGRLAATLFNVAALALPVTKIFAPANLWAILRGPRLPALTAEQAIAQFPEFGDLLSEPAVSTTSNRQ